ncbi:aspartate/glutamate racemase family protein [Bacillus sp. FJAT-27986]|uniref:aspartate/glutamate racemase family protein n=1 Tax=Bacillus sp. FJAT-27986 TaxID=1743146 RepID=UPI00080AC3B2|nr:aspartate/glutamate racemase family protein [Bacillus sp. FJAT-27986]OCA80761.1 arylsulfatase [Bacillus sp. FJAT-27986]
MHYGYIGPGTNPGQLVQKKGRYITGFSVGILYLDEDSYPVIPGNVANYSTFPFPVHYKLVPGCTGQRLLNNDRTLEKGIIDAAMQLQSEGAKVISSACGFFGNFHKQIANALEIPVYLSSLVQLSMIQVGLKPGQKIGILTAYEKGLTDSLLKTCGVTNRSNLIIGDLSQGEEFSSISNGAGTFNNEKLRDEVVKKAIEIKEKHPEVGAILLECSDLPPYAFDIQQAVQLPVYDFITLINWAHYANSQSPYYGFI